MFYLVLILIITAFAFTAFAVSLNNDRSNVVKKSKREKSRMLIYTIEKSPARRKDVASINPNTVQTKTTEICPCFNDIIVFLSRLPSAEAHKRLRVFHVDKLDRLQVRPQVLQKNLRRLDLIVQAIQAADANLHRIGGAAHHFLGV